MNTARGASIYRTENWSITEDGCTRTAVIDIEPEQVVMSTQLARQLGLSQAGDDAVTIDIRGHVLPGTVRVTYTDLAAAMTASGLAKVEEQA